MEQCWNDLHGFESKTRFGVAVARPCILQGEALWLAMSTYCPPKQQQYNHVWHCHSILLMRILRCLADDMDSCNLTSPLRGSKVNAIKNQKG